MFLLSKLTKLFFLADTPYLHKLLWQLTALCGHSDRAGAQVALVHCLHAVRVSLAVAVRRIQQEWWLLHNEALGKDTGHFHAVSCDTGLDGGLQAPRDDGVCTKEKYIHPPRVKLIKSNRKHMYMYV